MYLMQYACGASAKRKRNQEFLEAHANSIWTATKDFAAQKGTERKYASHIYEKDKTVLSTKEGFGMRITMSARVGMAWFANDMDGM